MGRSGKEWGGVWAQSPNHPITQPNGWSPRTKASSSPFSNRSKEEEGQRLVSVRLRPLTPRPFRCLLLSPPSLFPTPPIPPVHSCGAGSFAGPTGQLAGCIPITSEIAEIADATTTVAATAAIASTAAAIAAAATLATAAAAKADG